MELYGRDRDKKLNVHDVDEGDNAVNVSNQVTRAISSKLNKLPAAASVDTHLGRSTTTANPTVGSTGRANSTGTRQNGTARTTATATAAAAAAAKGNLTIRAAVVVIVLVSLPVSAVPAQSVSTPISVANPVPILH